MRKPYPIHCRCGQLQGLLTAPDRGVRLTCHCLDCQTAAHLLSDPDRTLDAQGGTVIVAALQSAVSFTQGLDRLACLSLSDRGIYRWYSQCCGTPIANTVRRPRMSYVGLVHTGLDGSMESVEATWPNAFNVNTAHAKGQVARPGLDAVAGALAIARRVVAARVAGRWRQSPFFTPTGRPVSLARTLAPAELERARKSASMNGPGSPR